MLKLVIRFLIVIATILFLYFFPLDEELSKYTKYILLMAFSILALTFVIKK